MKKIKILVPMFILGLSIQTYDASADTIQLPSQKKITRSNVLNVLKDVKGLSKYINDYKITDTKTFSDGSKVYILKRFIKNESLENTEIKLHVDKHNKPKLTQGDFYVEAIKQKSFDINKKEVRALVFKHIDKDAMNTNGSIIKSLYLGVQNNRLVWSVDVIYDSPSIHRYELIFDANTGQLLKKLDRLKQAYVAGYGVGFDGRTKILNLDFNETLSIYTMRDYSHRGVIETFDAHNRTDTAELFTSRSKYFTDITDYAGVDAHYYMDKVYDYYKYHFNRESYDNKASVVTNIVNYNQNYNNAFWSGSMFVFGAGDGVTYSNYAKALDVMAHEYQHAVTEASGDLEYSFQSGALNESLSDSFAYFVDPDPQIGEDIYTPYTSGDAIRDLQYPRRYGQPDHMLNYRVLDNTEAQDYGGVHINSGIPNKAFYNTIVYLGKPATEQIYYRAVTRYLVPTMTFSDFKQALLRSSRDLYGSQFDVYINRAWSSVGI